MATRAFSVSGDSTRKEITMKGPLVSTEAPLDSTETSYEAQLSSQNPTPEHMKLGRIF